MGFQFVGLGTLHGRRRRVSRCVVRCSGEVVGHVDGGRGESRRSLWEFVRGIWRPAPLDGEIARIAVPALATMAIDPLMSLVDTAFVGRLGVAELGAVGVSAALFKFSFSMFNFLAKTTTPLVASARVKQDYEKASRTIAQNLWVAGVAGLVIGVMLATFVRPFVALLVGSSSVSQSMIEPAVTYVRWRVVAAPAVLINYVCSGAFRGFKDTRTPMYVALLSNVTNLVLDYIMIFNWGMGVAGAALATAISQLVTAGGLILFMMRRKMFQIRHMTSKPDSETMKEIAASSVFSIRTMSILTAHTLASSLAARLGAVSSAAFAIGRQIWMFQAIALDSVRGNKKRIFLLLSDSL